MSNYTHLSMNERQRLSTYLEMGYSIKTISQKLSRHRSTVYREVNRNKDFGKYLPGVAHEKANSRAFNGRMSKLNRNGYLRDYVVRAVKKGWSPEQISGRMKYQKLTIYVCPETIYQYVYKSKDKELYHCLPYKQPKRRKRYARKKHQCRFGDMRLITERPVDINLRTRFGHWEGDTVQFTGNKKQVVTTLVERKSRMVFLIKNNSKHSKEVMGKIGDKFEKLPQKMCKTITFDQGTEFADYRHLESTMKCQVYYCETHSPWQKGTNENMNGRLRRYLPSTTIIDQITQKELDLLADKMNLCPRKCLGYKMPKEVFIQQYKNDCRTWS
ncbi:IS30 family transposase [Legionella tunisiensis]|uniref:IS30 family transposase n=1 Tax=Legionella tunisiensis TaxID=1034944 RepID=UPI0003190914|nr:IS30 family transposase [Legionella tunisiensis]